jgi:hypothetical protein
MDRVELLPCNLERKPISPAAFPDIIPALRSLDGSLNMKLYVTFTSPYARLARILVLEKMLWGAAARNCIHRR